MNFDSLNNTLCLSNLEDHQLFKKVYNNATIGLNDALAIQLLVVSNIPKKL